MSQLTIFLIKESVTALSDIIDSPDDLEQVPVIVSGKYFGTLFVERGHPHPPKWLRFFGDNAELARLKLNSQSSAAVLLTKRMGRHFALTFGHGRHLLCDAVVEPRFGIRTALNAVEGSKLRSIDHTRLDAVPRMTREQLSKAAGLEQFGLDVERDMLRALTGAPSDETLGSTLSGSDQLSVVGKIPLEDLGEQLDRYHKLAAKTTYKDQFGWVDNISHITDSAFIDALEESIAEQIDAGERNAIWLNVPEIVDWTTVGGFRFSADKDGPVFPDLDLDNYMDHREAAGGLNRDALHAERVFCENAGDEHASLRWPVYRCLVADIEHAGRRYVLSDGKWYAIEQDFVAAVEEAIQGIPATLAPLPPAKIGEAEGSYNERCFRQGKGEFSLMDKKLAKFSAPGRVEICDLYWHKRALLHVKHYGASGVLSHLFSQGTVSAQLFQQDALYRAQMLEKVATAAHWGSATDPIRTPDFEIGYAIVVRPNRNLRLPFFSKVNLRNANRLLRSFGYKVSLTAIPTK